MFQEFAISAPLASRRSESRVAIVYMMLLPVVGHRAFVPDVFMLRQSDSQCDWGWNNEAIGLTVWDLRISGANDPQRVFHRWGRWGGSIAFDLDETGTYEITGEGECTTKRNATAQLRWCVWSGDMANVPRVAS